MTTLIVFALYSLIILSIALYAYGKTQNYQDYILGGRRFGGLVTAMGVAATDMSAWLMLSVPAVFYLYGMNQIWLPVGLLLGSFINWHYIAPRLRVYTLLANNSLTLPSFLQNRFMVGDRAKIRMASAIIFLIFFTCYAASGFVGAAKLFSTIFELNYHHALLVSAPVVIFYTAIGGYLAVNWIDLFQGLLMLFTLLFLALFALWYVDAQPAMMLGPIASARLDVFHQMTVLSLISGLGWGLGYFGQPHILVRFMSSQSIKSIRVGKYICLSWMFVALCSAAIVGLLGYIYFPTGTLTSAEVIFPALAQYLFADWFSALAFAAIISAIISTVAAVLFASASSLVEDLYAPFLRSRASEKELMWVGRLMVLVVALVAVLLAYQGENPSVFELVSHAWGGLGAAFGPVVVMALFWKRMSYIGACLGMIMGGVVTLIWIYCSYVSTLPIFSVFEIVPGFLAGLAGVILGTYVWPQHTSTISTRYNEYLTQLITPERRSE